MGRMLTRCECQLSNPNPCLQMHWILVSHKYLCGSWGNRNDCTMPDRHVLYETAKYHLQRPIFRLMQVYHPTIKKGEDAFLKQVCPNQCHS